MFSVRKLGLICIVILVAGLGTSESVVKQWEYLLGTRGPDEGAGIATDASGNVYVTGHVVESLDGQPHMGISDILLVKYTPSGTKQWTRLLGSASVDRGHAVAVDTSGNIYVTGYTWDALDGQTSAGGHDIFLIKYDSSGTKQWTRQLGTSGWDIGYGIAVGTSGSVYITGYTEGALDGQTSSGAHDIFLTKYDSSGTIQWTSQFGSASVDIGRDVAVDASGNIYVTGYSNGTIDAQPRVGLSDIFLSKYDSSGTRLWTRMFGSTNNDHGYGVDTDASGNVYVTGEVEGTMDGQPQIGDLDTFLTKYDSNGTKQWTRVIGTVDSDRGFGVAAGLSGEIYLTGATVGSLGGEPIAGMDDAFLVQFDSSGTVQWTRLVGTDTSEQGYGVAVDPYGDACIVGNTDGNLGGQTNEGDFDAFVTKWSINDSPALSWTGETGYTADGLEPETGTSTTTFTYRIRYTDTNNNVPMTGYPRVLVLGDGATVQTLVMNYESGNFDTGAVYSAATFIMSPGLTYEYLFEAYDIYGASSTGITSGTGPEVSSTVYAIDGYVLQEDSVTAVSGIYVELTGYTTGTTITDIDGHYRFDNLLFNKSYTVTPTYSSGTVIPVSRSTAALTGDINGWNFIVVPEVILPLDPVLSVDTDSLTFGPLDPKLSESKTFKIINTGGGTLVGIITKDKDWITITPTSFQGSTITVGVTVTNINLQDGEYTGSITIASVESGYEIVTVTLQATCVLAKPNPYDPTKGNLTFFGDGIVPAKTKIQIYALSGELIKTLTSDVILGLDPGIQLSWDGKNENGQTVSPGIYIYTYESPKEKGIGKFTVVR